MLPMADRGQVPIAPVTQGRAGRRLHVADFLLTEGVYRAGQASLPAFAMTPLKEVVTESVAQRRFSMLLLAVFAVSWPLG